jgi:lipid II:glycine glycyltransferase (peptidoglycan interpeptide bridge formation enzyme)
MIVVDRRFTTARKAMWHAVDFARSEGELWVGLSGSARQNVRKAKRNGAVVRERRSIEAVRTFYSVHFQLRKSKYRLLAQPVAFFENLHQLFASHTDLRSEQIGHMLKRITHLLTEPTVPDEVTASAGDELHRFFC